MMRMHTWAPRTKDSTPLCISCICSFMLRVFLLPSRLERWRYHLDPLICNPPYCSSPLPYTRNRRFATPLQAATTTSQLTLKAYRSSFGSHALVSEQPYTKYLCIYLLGIFVASVRLMAVITTGSFLGLRGVFLRFTSPSQNANRLGEYHSLYPCRPVTWVPLPPSLEFSRLSPFFPSLCVARGMIRSCSCRWAAGRVLLLSLSLM